MRILLVVSTFDGSGPGRVAAGLARELTQRGNDCLVVATHGSERAPVLDELRGSGVATEHLAMRGMLDPAGPRRLLDLVRRFRPAVVHSRSMRADLIARVVRRAGAKVLNNIVAMYPDDAISLHGPLLGRAELQLARFTARSVDLFVPNAHRLAAPVREVFRVPPERVRVVHDGLDLTRWMTAAPADLAPLGIDADEAVCLAVGRLHHMKGFGDLLAAVALVHRSRPDLRFVIAGDGPLRGELERQIARLRLDTTVVLAGWRDDVPALLARSSVFVFPSHLEGLPGAVIEAMAAEVPVVATSVGGLPELIDDGGTGWLVPPSTPEDVAAAIQQAMGPEGRVRARAARAVALDRFSVAKMAARFSEIYSKLASQ